MLPKPKMETASSEDAKKTPINFECASEIQRVAIYPLPGMPRGKQVLGGILCGVSIFQPSSKRVPPQNVGRLPQGSWKFKDQTDHEIDNMGDRKPSPLFFQ